MKNKALNRILITTLGIIAVMNTGVVKADTTWDLSGSYVFEGWDTNGFVTFNDLTINSINLVTGNFSGIGNSAPGGNWYDPAFTWGINGTVTGSSITAQLWNTGDIPGYSEIWYDTSINPDGSISGYDHDIRNTYGTFETISGHANQVQVVPVLPSIWLFCSVVAGFIGFNRRKTI